MKIGVRVQDRCLELYLKGELDHHGARGAMDDLDREIALALPLKLILDFRAVSFMDSSGIAVVMRARQRMQELGGAVTLRGLAAQPRKVLDAAGINRLVEME